MNNFAIMLSNLCIACLLGHASGAPAGQRHSTGRENGKVGLGGSADERATKCLKFAPYLLQIRTNPSATLDDGCLELVVEGWNSTPLVLNCTQIGQAAVGEASV